MNVNKQKVKEFVIEHKGELTIAGLMVLSGIVGYKFCERTRIGDDIVINHDGMKNVIRDAANIYNNKGPVFTAIVDGDPFKPEELGELGKHMCNVIDENKYGFTHFIAIGKKVET